MDITVKFTERALHAREICAKELVISEYDTVITVSGDGLIHEVVNGLCHRADWQELKETINIGFIPGGTGNALTKSVLFTSKEEYGVQEAAFLVAKGRKMLMDCTEIEGEYEPHKIFSFLSVAWAYVADCDINSEAIRCIGSPRFTMWGIYRILFLRKYMGCFSYNGFQV
jgi:sphingosine kinase